MNAQTAVKPAAAAAATVSFPADVLSVCAINTSTGVVAGLADGRIAIWDGRATAPSMVVHPHSGGVRGVASTADGREVWSVATDGVLSRMPVTGEQPVSRRLDFGAMRPNAGAFSSDGSMLVAGGALGELRVFDTASAAVKRELRGHRTELQCLSVRPGSSIVASASAEADLRIWDMATGREIGSADGDLSLFALAFSSRDGTLACGGVDRRLTLRDAVTFKPTGELVLKAPKMVATLAWSPDGRWIAVGDLDDTTLSKGEIQIVDAATRAVVARLDTGGPAAAALAFTGDGAVLVAGVGRGLLGWTLKSLIADR